LKHIAIIGALLIFPVHAIDILGIGKTMGEKIIELREKG